MKLGLKWPLKNSKLGSKNKTFESIQNEDGFSLIEIIIAIAIFSVFVSSYMLSYGTNVESSRRMRYEQQLIQIAEDKLGELQALYRDPKNKLDCASKSLAPETSPCGSEEPYSDYECTFEYKELDLTNLIKSAAEMLQRQAQESGQGAGVQAVMNQVTNEFGRGLKQHICQLKISVQHNEIQSPFFLTTWILNTDKSLKFRIP